MKGINVHKGYYMKNIVYLEELEEKSLEIIGFSRLNIEDKINELEAIVKDFKWTGKGHDIYVDNYLKKIIEFRKMNKKMALFGEYLQFCSEHYGETHEKLNKSWKEFLDKKKVIDDELQQ